VSARRILVPFVASAAVAPLGFTLASAQDVPISGPADRLIERLVGAASEASEGDEAPGDLQGGVALPEDPDLRRRLAQAVRLAENGRPEDAAQAIGRLAEAVGDSDAFVRDGRSMRSVKAEVQRLIGDARPEARAAYELVFGPPARRMLDDSPNDPSQIRRVATLYPQTRAGAEALYRFAAVRADEGAYLEAAGCLERLARLHPVVSAEYEPTLSLRLAACRIRSGDRRAAEAALAAVAERFPGGVASVAGVGRPVGGMAATSFTFAEADAPAVAAYTPHPADADAPASEAPEPFPVPRWSASLADSEAAVERGPAIGVTVPAASATVVGGLVLAPRGRGFVACALATGLRLWSYPTGEVSGGADSIWTALSTSHLSTDGRAVFLVEASDSRGAASWAGGPAAVQVVPQRGVFPNPGAFAAPNVGPTALATLPSANALTTLDVTPPRQGNRLWRVGGADGGDEPRLAGHAFLGPPLAAGGRLFAVTERDRTVRLVVLEAGTGRLDWGLDLGQADVSVAADPERRRVGATPTLSRGILFCPTAGGSVVAVDLAGRSLLWGFRYARTSPPLAAGWDGVVAAAGPPGWRDATIRVAAGRVFLTPPEAGAAFCLDLATGRVLWQRPRGDDLFLAAADERRVLFVGPSGATLLSAADGSPAGPVAPFPAGTSPTGRGYPDRGGFVVPLSDGSLRRVDLASGSSSTVARSSRGVVLGNLVWHDGTMLSLGADRLRAFDGRLRLEAEVAAALVADRGDAAALPRRADLHAEAGRYADAIADCRAAYRTHPSPGGRNRLVAALLDGLRHGLPDDGGFDAELEALSRR